MSSDSKWDNSALSQIIVPLDIEELGDVFKKFQDFKNKLVTKDDWQEIQGKRYLKKAGCRKWGLACNVSDEIIEQVRVPSTGRDPETGFYWRFVVRAFHLPTGRSTVGVAIATSSEKSGWAHLEHDVYTLAHTRAKNRAILDLVGGGEVSAEEMIPSTDATESTGSIGNRAAPSEWHVPRTKTTEQVTGVTEEPIFHRQSAAGLAYISQQYSEISAVPDNSVKADSGPVKNFLIKKILEPIKAKHPEVRYELSVDDEGFLQAVLVKMELDPERMKEFLDACGWAFAKANEKSQETSQS